MDKTDRQELRRLFLVEQLPEPLTRADRHLQVFDNYLANTRLRLRAVRVPEIRQWSRILQQRSATGAGGAGWKIAEIHLNEEEYRLFQPFEGREIRKNRYFYEADGRRIEIDLFLGELRGLILARVVFETLEELAAFAFPFKAIEVTADDFFRGENLVGKNFADVQARIAESL